MSIVCRLCAVSKEPINIRCTIDDLKPEIKIILVICCELDVHHNPLSLTRNVCNLCCSTLEHLLYFRDNVSHAQKRLCIDSSELDVSLLGSLKLENQPNDNNNYEIGGSEYRDVIDDGSEIRAMRPNSNSTGCGDKETELIDTDTKNIEIIDVLKGNDIDGRISGVDDEQNIEADSDNAIIENRLSRTFGQCGIASKSQQNTAQAGHIFNISSMVNANDINQDGTIKDEKVREHNFSNWASITIPCSKCDDFLGDHIQLERHFEDMHSEEKLEYVCSYCEGKEHFSSELAYRNHVTEIHFPHLAHW